ncbi:hypothetical protein [Devosia aquimaris]|uniref:hypothetical protein n=1 Tax=Devosia aquimaris TaxID=2866214 RepID=UPI001CD103FE|nr:hypothetical protein [Devosia sp. CJK-A8-3]
MIRPAVLPRPSRLAPLALVALFGLCLGAAQAQEAAPAAAPEAPANVVIDPAADVSKAPKQSNLLTGFYATQAVIEICALPIDDAVKTGMAGDLKRLETSVGLDDASAATAYAKVKADVEKTQPDCAEGSADRASVDAVTAIYAEAAAKAAAATAAAAAGTAVPVDPAAVPATPAQ